MCFVDGLALQAQELSGKYWNNPALNHNEKPATRVFGRLAVSDD